MRKYTRQFAIVATVVVLLTFGVSLLFAASPTQDYDTNRSGMIDRGEAYRAIDAYFGGSLTQGETIDVLLHYWGQEPVSGRSPAATPRPTATPAPQPTATPTPTATPAPIPTPLPMLTECLSRSHGELRFNRYTPITGSTPVSDLVVVSGIRSNVDVMFMNHRTGGAWKEAEYFKYGFKISHPGSTFTIEVDHLGQWTLMQGRKIVEIGRLSDHGVPFNTGEGERNQLTYFAGDGERTANNAHNFENPSFWVNGVKVPIDFKAVGIYRGTGPKYSGTVTLISVAVKQRYENLCAVEAWREKSPDS